MVSLLHCTLHVGLEEGLGRSQCLLILEFLGDFVLDTGLNLLNLLVTMLLGILFNGNLLLLTKGASPKLDFSEFLFLLFFDLLALLLEHLLIELNNGVVFNFVVVLLEVLNLVFADLFEALDGQNVKNFEGSGLLLLVKEFEEDVSLLSLGVSDLLLFLFSLLTSNIGKTLLFKFSLLLGLLLCKLLLNLGHFLSMTLSV